MTNVRFAILLTLSCLSAVSTIQAQGYASESTSKRIYIKPYGGFIGIQDMNLRLVENSSSSSVSVESGFGFTSGISFGYDFTKNISAEFGWEYKSNDITLTNNNVQVSGDYASNFIYLNGIYRFTTQNRFKPYLGVGASLIQEIDLDFGSGEDASFSDSGNIGFQGLAGLDFNLSKRWALNWEVKYVSFENFEMKNETTNSTLTDLEYNPFILNIGVKYRL
ncbi:MAG: OmpW family outer membrane protein [Bacteroidota bacterium]